MLKVLPPASLPNSTSHHPPPTMQIFASALLAATMAAQAVVATPIRARTPYEVKETHYAPREWTKLERANGAKTVQLQIGLKQGNMVGFLAPI